MQCKKKISESFLIDSIKTPTPLKNVPLMWNLLGFISDYNALRKL